MRLTKLCCKCSLALWLLSFVQPVSQADLFYLVLLGGGGGLTMIMHCNFANCIISFFFFVPGDLLVIPCVLKLMYGVGVLFSPCVIDLFVYRGHHLLPRNPK